MKFIRFLSAILLAVMLFATLAPCISAQTANKIEGVTEDVTLNKDTEPTYTRKYTFNDSEKMEYNNQMLTDPAKYNGSKSFEAIYDIFKEQIRGRTAGETPSGTDASYNFKTPSSSIGTIVEGDSSWSPSWHKTKVTLPELSEEHPRLLVTKDNIPTIRKALEENTPTNERFFALLDMDVYQPRALNSDGSPADTVKNGVANGGINMGKLGTAKDKYYANRPGVHNYDGYYLEVIQAKALGYLIDGHELYGKQAIHCMKQFLRTLNIKITSNQEREFGNVMFTAALVYDWCYPLLDNEDKKQLVAAVEHRIGRISYTVSGTDYTSFSIGFPPNKAGAVSGHGSERQLLRDMLAASIAFYGYNNSWYNYIGTLFYEHYVPVRQYYFKSGISQQGVGTYVSGRHIADMYSAWIMLTAAADSEKNQERSDLGKYPYMVNGENLIANTVRNFLGYETKEGMIFTDGDGGGFGVQQQYNYEFHALSYMTAYLFEDEAMLAQARDMRPNYAFGTDKNIDITIEIQSPLYVALTGMSDISPAEDKYEGMPLIQYNGAPVGQYVTHEKFGVDDSASLFMKVKVRSTANHEHADAGNFMIYYKGMLTADTGCYSGYSTPHTRYYHQATISHNSLLVYNTSSTKPDFPSGDKDYYTGGQIWPDEASTLSELKSDTYHTGNVIGQRDGYYDAAKTQPKFAYLGGDITGAYSSSTVDYVGRRMLVVYTGDEEVPMLFFTYDRITADAGGYQKTYLFHITSKNAPTVNTTNRTVVTENGGGQLVLTCVSDDVTIASIGGRVLDSNGKLNDAKNSGTKNYWLNDTVGQVAIGGDDGAWGRVEIKNKNSEKSSSFLNAMYVTDAGNTNRYQTKSITNVSTGAFASGAVDLEGAVYNGKVAAVFVANTIKWDGTSSVSGNTKLNSKTVSFTTEGESSMQYYVDGMAEGNWVVSVNGVATCVAKSEGGLLTFDAPAGNITLTKEAADVTAKKNELLTALGDRIADDGSYSPEAYGAYSEAYDAIVEQINSALDLTALNAIDVAKLKESAEAKLTMSLEDLKAALIESLGAKLTNSDSKYTSDSYSAYSNAYNAIVTQINSAESTDALNALDIETLKKTAENKLVLTVDKMKADLIAELGEKKSNANGDYTDTSYSSYTTAYNAILTQIDSATTVAELNDIDIATLRANAEAKLRSAFQEKKETLLATLGTKKDFSAALYTQESYQEYSAAFEDIVDDINSATTVSELNAINVTVRKASAEALLKEPIIEKDTITDLTLTVSKDLKLNYLGETSTEEVYSVDVTWDDIAFAYTGGTTKWNPSSHAYDDVKSAAKWTDASGSVKVANHSNASVAVAITFEPLSTANGTAKLTVNGGSFTLSSAVVGSAYTSAPAQTATITASGIPAKSGAVGKIKVKISSK